MQHDKKIVDDAKVEELFTQEEVNQMMRKRLTRVKRRFDREFQHKILLVEVMGRLVKENIPTRFAQFIIISKNTDRTRKTLEQFITTWQKTVKK